MPVLTPCPLPKVSLRWGQLQDAAGARGPRLAAAALPQPLPALRRLHLRLRGHPLHGGAGGRGEGWGRGAPSHVVGVPSLCGTQSNLRFVTAARRCTSCAAPPCATWHSLSPAGPPASWPCPPVSWAWCGEGPDRPWLSPTPTLVISLPQEPAGQQGTRGQRTPWARSPPRAESSSPRGLRQGEAEPCAAASLRHGLPFSSSSTPNNKPKKSRAVAAGWQCFVWAPSQKKRLKPWSCCGHAASAPCSQPLRQHRARGGRGAPPGPCLPPPQQAESC